MNVKKLLAEHFGKEEKPSIRVDRIFREGDFIVYFESGSSTFVMYHKCDGLMWRTAAEQLRGMTSDKSEVVDGIRGDDAALPIVRAGSNFGA